MAPEFLTRSASDGSAARCLYDAKRMYDELYGKALVTILTTELSTQTTAAWYSRTTTADAVAPEPEPHAERSVATPVLLKIDP